MNIKELLRKFPIKITAFPADVPTITDKTPERIKNEFIFQNKTNELAKVITEDDNVATKDFIESTDNWSDERLKLENYQKDQQIKIVGFFQKVNKIKSIISMIIVFFVILFIMELYLK